MIAAYAVIVALSLAAGSRGYRLIAFLRFMHWKLLVLTFVLSIMMLTLASPSDLLILSPFTYVMLWAISIVSFGLGQATRLGRRA